MRARAAVDYSEAALAERSALASASAAERAGASRRAPRAPLPRKAQSDEEEDEEEEEAAAASGSDEDEGRGGGGAGADDDDDDDEGFRKTKKKAKPRRAAAAAPVPAGLYATFLRDAVAPEVLAQRFVDKLAVRSLPPRGSCAHSRALVRRAHRPAPPLAPSFRSHPRTTGRRWS